MSKRLRFVALLALGQACREVPAPTYAAPLPRVGARAVEAGPLELRETLWGEVATPPGRQARLSSLESGYLADFRVAEGDPIRRGQDLVDITAGPSRDQVEQARARLVQAGALATEARAREARTADLLHRGASSTREAEQSRAAARIADAAVLESRAAVDAAVRHLAHSEIRAPFDGQVIRLLASPGEAVPGAGVAVIEVADGHDLELHATASAAQAMRIRVGQPARVSFPTIPELPELTAEVLAISPGVDPTTGTQRIRLSLPGRAPAPKLGLYGRAEVQVGRLQSALWIPASAVQELPEQPRPFALLLRPDRHVERRPLTLGARDGERIQITAGLAAGERVVVSGGYGLPDGAAVDVAP